MTTVRNNDTRRTRRIPYRELRNGDRVWICGYLFEATNVRVTSRKGDRTTMHGDPNVDDVIRFEGRLVDDTVDIARTSYNGGTYGGYGFVEVTIEDGGAR